MVGRSQREIGARIQAARKRYGLTQEQLAAKIGKAPESISNIERGTQSPTIDTLMDVAEVLGLPVTEIMGRKSTSVVKSKTRLQQEAKLWELARSMSDVQLAVLVAQAQVLDEILGSITQNQK